jgi:hypothetical protein
MILQLGRNTKGVHCSAIKQRRQSPSMVADIMLSTFLPRSRLCDCCCVDACRMCPRVWVRHIRGGERAKQAIWYGYQTRVME